MTSPSQIQQKRGNAHEFFRDVVLPYKSHECLTWPFTRYPRGYGRITLHRKSYLVHRLACEAVNGAPPLTKSLACHSCGNGHLGCVNPQHIYWGTPRDNQLDRAAHGTSNRGPQHGASKLTNEDVLAIRAASGAHSEIAARFGIARQTVGKIKARMAWSWL